MFTFCPIFVISDKLKSVCNRSFLVAQGRRLKVYEHCYEIIWKASTSRQAGSRLTLPHSDYSSLSYCAGLMNAVKDRYHWVSFLNDAENCSRSFRSTTGNKGSAPISVPTPLASIATISIMGAIACSCIILRACAVASLTSVFPCERSNSSWRELTTSSERETCSAH